MRHWLDKLTDLAAIPGDERIVKHGLARFTEEMGFAGYAYVNILSSHAHIVSNYGPEWQSEYAEQHYFEIDPVVRRARALTGAFTWSGERERSQLSKKERSFYAHAADFGIRSGVTIPIRAAHGTLAIFTLASERPESDLNMGWTRWPLLPRSDSCMPASALPIWHRRFRSPNFSIPGQPTISTGSPKARRNRKWQASTTSLITACGQSFDRRASTSTPRIPPTLSRPPFAEG